MAFPIRKSFSSQFVLISQIPISQQKKEIENNEEGKQNLFQVDAHQVIWLRSRFKMNNWFY